MAGRIFGSSNSWLSWHWREVTLGATVGVLVLGCGVLLVVRRRRRRLQPTS